MKWNRLYSNLAISFLVALTVSGCGGNEWSRKDQRKLLDRCEAEGGTSSYCKCYLKNAMEQYPNAEDIETIDFESAVELSIDCQ